MMLLLDRYHDTDTLTHKTMPILIAIPIQRLMSWLKYAVNYF